MTTIVLRCHVCFCLRALRTTLRRTVIFSLECPFTIYLCRRLGGGRGSQPWESLRKKAVGGLAEVKSAHGCVLSKAGKSLRELGKEPWATLGQPPTTVASSCSSSLGLGPLTARLQDLMALWWTAGGDRGFQTP